MCLHTAYFCLCTYSICPILSLSLSVSAPTHSSMVPLLQLISRGSPMSFEDSNRIIPLFYLFSSLFSHSLISVHDSEFFGHEMEGIRLVHVFNRILESSLMFLISAIVYICFQSFV